MLRINNYFKKRIHFFTFQRIRTFLTYFTIFNHIFISVAQASFIPIDSTNVKRAHHFPYSFSDSLDFEKNEEHPDESRSIFMRWVGKISDPISRISGDIVVALIDSVSEKLDSFLEWSYKELKDISILNAKNMQEAVFDKAFWKSTFIATIEEMHNSKNLTEVDYNYLIELQGLVWAQVLSPYSYSEGLQELKNPKTRHQIIKIEKEFEEKFQEYPALLEAAFKHDIIENLIRIQELKSDNLKFNNLLIYYKHFINTLDYNDILLNFDNNLNDKGLGFSQQKNLQDIRLMLKNALHVMDEVQYEYLAFERTKQIKTLRELPFFYEELDAQGLWADVENYIDPSEKLTSHSKSFSYPKMAYNLKKI